MATQVVGDEIDYVDGGGWVSDDSDYYGDDETVKRLERSCRQRDVSQYWELHARLPSVIAFRNRPKLPRPLPPKHQPNSVLDTADRRKRKASDLEEDPVTSTVIKGKGRAVEPASSVAPIPTASTTHYIPNLDFDLEGQTNIDPSVLSALLADYPERHPSETVEAFLARIRPSESHIDVYGDWIWIRNPNVRQTPDDDEHEVKQRGFALLDAYKVLENKIRLAMPDKAQATITRKLKPEREKLEAALRKTAIDLGCVSGKWMLFPKEDDVDRIWRAVCKGVDSGKLGPTAKVATGGGEMRSSRDEGVRLICVYTYDFSDLQDVRRVLDALIELGLVKRPEDDVGNGIYYKCDAWTHWGLGSGNEFKIKASMYGSKEMLSNGGKNGFYEKKKR